MLDTKRLLDQFLGQSPVSARAGRGDDLGALLGQLGGRSGLGGALGGALGGSGMGSSGMGSSGAGGGLGGLMSSNAAKGALAAGLASMLLKGGRRPRGGLGSAAKMGGLALVAGLAYKAYQAHQAQQSGQGMAQGAPEAPASARGAITPPSDTKFLPQDEAGAQDRARLILRAMIAAAKADGHVDAEEQTRLYEAMDALDLDANDKAFVMDELRAPLDVAAIASAARGPEEGSEIYVASLMALDDPDPAERRYLDELALRLNLPTGLAASLEAEVDAQRE